MSAHNDWSQDDDLSDGLHDKQDTFIEGPVAIHIGSVRKEPETKVEFHNLVAPTIPPKTERTFESMRVLLRNGVAAIVVIGVSLVLLMVFNLISSDNASREKAVLLKSIKDLEEKIDAQGDEIRRIKSGAPIIDKLPFHEPPSRE